MYSGCEKFGVKRNNPEREIHLAVADHLRRRAKPDVVWFHVPNAPRSAVTGAILKRMGMLAGVSDFILFHARELFALELKAPGGRATESQLEFISRIQANGGHGVVAEGLDEALGCLSLWGVFR